MNIINSVTKFKSKYVWVAPVFAALVYPFILMTLFHSGKLLHDATNSIDTAIAIFVLILSFLLVLGVPTLCFVAAYYLGQIDAPTPSQIRARRIAHLVFASPPLYTCIGVMLFVLVDSSSYDYLFWAIIWVPIVILSFRSNLAIGARILPPAAFNWQRLGVIRSIHGITALAILLVYLVPHIANHLSAIWSLELNWRMMEMLRQWYRADGVEPIVIVLIYCQIFTGVTLWRPRTAHHSDLFGVIQTTSGAYLSIFIFSHTTAVFLLARSQGVDTTFAWAAGYPDGLLGDAWNVRLIPHHTLAVWMLFTHLACGWRFRLLDGKVLITRADRIAWSIIGGGFVIAIAIVLALLGNSVISNQ